MANPQLEHGYTRIAHEIDWVEDLARRAGLPEGGAGPGPGSIDLTGIGRDLNDLEDPHGT